MMFMCEKQLKAKVSVFFNVFFEEAEMLPFMSIK